MTAIIPGLTPQESQQVAAEFAKVLESASGDGEVVFAIRRRRVHHSDTKQHLDWSSLPKGEHAHASQS